MKEARESLDAFEKEYLENNQKYPDKYPLEIPIDNAGVWWEFLNENLW